MGNDFLWPWALSEVELRAVQEGYGLVNLLVHHDVVLHEGHLLAVFLEEAFQQGRRLERPAELDALGGVHQFDGKDVVQVVHDAEQLGGGIGPHTDVVLLSVAGDDGVRGRGVAIHLVLADHGRGGVLRNHEAGVQSRVGHQEFGQAAQAHDELCHAPFGDVAQFGQGDAQVVVDQREGLAVEVAAGDDEVLIGEDGGIVRHRVDFRQQHRGRVADGILGGAVHLRHAAEGVGVLHVLLGPGNEFAAFEQAAEVVARLNLSPVRADLLDAVHEGVDASVEGFERQGGDEVGPAREALGLEDGKDAVGRHELRAVQQGQALLAHQADGFPAEFVQHADGLAFPAFVVDVAHADEGQEEVGQRGQVARRAQRAAVVDDGQDVVVEEVQDALHGDDLHAAVPQRQGMCLEQHHQLDDDGAYFFAHAARMALDEVLLQRAQFVGGDVLVAQRAEARGDAIERLVGLGDLLVQVVAAALDARFGFRGQLQLQVLGQDAFDELEGQVA